MDIANERGIVRTKSFITSTCVIVLQYSTLGSVLGPVLFLVDMNNYSAVIYNKKRRKDLMLKPNNSVDVFYLFCFPDMTLVTGLLGFVEAGGKLK